MAHMDGVSATEVPRPNGGVRSHGRPGQARE